MLYYITGNKNKVINANIVLKEYGITLTARELPLVEIQTDSLKEIALYKAKQAFAKIKKPLVVNDTGWEFESLHGFPGVYMQYINKWFTAQDYLSLMNAYTNRKVILKQAVCYIDHQQTKVFFYKLEGTIGKSPKGKGPPSETVCSFRKDGKTMSECQNAGIYFSDDSKSVWHIFAKWYKNNKI